MTRILILDSDHEMGTLYSLILKRAGYEYFFTDNSEESRILLQTRSIDLLILDSMLASDSWAFIETMKKEESLHYIPIILLLARDTPGHPKADAYIAKPVSPSELLTTVKNLLNKYGRQATPA